MNQYILFDFDGTLVDSRQAALTIVNQLADKYHFKRILPEDIEPLRKLSILQRCRFLKLPLYKIPFIVREARLLYRSHLQNICLFEGIKAMLEELTKRHFTLAVLSSNSQSNIRAIFQNNHIDTVESIVGGSTLFSKEILIKNFIKTNKLHPSQLIYVGDELRDVIACKKSGIPIIWVSWGYDAVEAVRAANTDYIINKPEEILSIVDTYYKRP